jgi:hypothetical protein
MAGFLIHDRIYSQLRRHLRGRIEQAAFLIADYDERSREFQARDVCLVDAAGFAVQTSFHISLADETRAELIRWAWDAGASLVEVHSHSGRTPAAFSASDLSGFAEWVPHLWWRLSGRPYLAIVTAGSSFDGLAWIDEPARAEQLERISLSSGRSLESTRLTLTSLAADKAGRNRTDG